MSSALTCVSPFLNCIHSQPLPLCLSPALSCVCTAALLPVYSAQSSPLCPRLWSVSQPTSVSPAQPSCVFSAVPLCLRPTPTSVSPVQPLIPRGYVLKCTPALTCLSSPYLCPIPSPTQVAYIQCVCVCVSSPHHCPQPSALFEGTFASEVPIYVLSPHLPYLWVHSPHYYLWSC